MICVFCYVLLCVYVPLLFSASLFIIIIIIHSVCIPVRSSALCVPL